MALIVFANFLSIEENLLSTTLNVVKLYFQRRRWFTSFKIQSYLDIIAWGHMSQLDENNCQIVNEEESINEGESKLDDIRVFDLVAVLDQMNSIKQPERHNENQHQKGNQSSKHENSRQSCFWFSQKHGPGPN